MVTKFLLIISVFMLFSSAAHATIVRFFNPSPNIYRGGQPMDDADYERLKNLGIKTIVNLRDDGEFEETVAKKFGFKWYLFPMNGLRVPADPVLDGALAVINDPASQPVFVHCRVGKDRTGMVMAIQRVLVDKWTILQAYTEMRAFGFNRALLPLLYTFFKRTLYPPTEASHIRNLPAAPIVVGN